jgi:hypothetical protein
MGRPPLGNKATLVRLPPDLGDRIDAVMGGPNRRAKFIREAVEIELDRREGAAKAKRPKE